MTPMKAASQNFLVQQFRILRVLLEILSFLFSPSGHIQMLWVSCIVTHRHFGRWSYSLIAPTAKGRQAAQVQTLSLCTTGG